MIANSHETTHESKRINIPRQWVNLLYRLFALSDGEHIIILKKNAGDLQTWQHAEVGKTETPTNNGSNKSLMDKIVM